MPRLIAAGWDNDPHSIAEQHAFPDFLCYHKLLAKVTWLQPVIGFDVFWVSESGEVRRESAV